MKAFIALSLFIAVASAGILPPLVPVMPLENMEGRITNGELAVAGQFPFQVALNLFYGNSNGWCGGILISDLWILTAAHCTEGANAAIAILGATDIGWGYERGSRRIYTDNIIIHDNWISRNFTNDISLIKLPFSIEFNDRIQPATLPKMNGNYATYANDLVWASGWGSTSDSSSAMSQYLRYIKVPVMEQSMCATYVDILTNKMICISTPNGQSACRGDSGGPLIYKDGDINYVIGASSFGTTLGCEKGWPSVYTRITAYLDWIEKISGVVNK